MAVQEPAVAAAAERIAAAGVLVSGRRVAVGQAPAAVVAAVHTAVAAEWAPGHTAVVVAAVAAPVCTVVGEGQGQEHTAAADQEQGGRASTAAAVRCIVV